MTDYKYTWAAYAEAFTIFAKYEPDVFGELSAEHDQIWAGPEPGSAISDDDKARLEALDWQLDEDIDRFTKFV